MIKLIIAVIAGYWLKSYVDKRGSVQAAIANTTGKEYAPIVAGGQPASDSSIASQIIRRYLTPNSGPPESGVQNGYETPPIYSYHPLLIVKGPTGGQVQ